MKDNTAPGEDSMIAEMFKDTDTGTVEKFHSLNQTIWEIKHSRGLENMKKIILPKFVLVLFVVEITKIIIYTYFNITLHSEITYFQPKLYQLQWC